MLSAQLSTCFEIESLLVDACAEASGCGSAAADACQCEGKNEMMRFRVGPNDLDLDDMEVDWPNGFNGWLGVCQNATTADVVEALNATIVSCGLLVEPTNDILPANSNVLMINSTDVCTDANSFAGLADTLIIIFQCPGNYQGHFANYGTNGNTARTVEVDFGPGCADEVTYFRDQLVDASGVPGTADGAGVSFTPDGQATYFNFGCTAPIEQQLFSAGSDGTICPGESFELNGQASDSFGTPVWSGGTGTFSETEDLGASYTPGAGDGDEIVLTLTAIGCNGIVTDEVVLSNAGESLTGIDSDGVTAICDGQEVTLTAEGSGFFQWSTNVFAPSITVDEPGEYSVSVTTVCGTVTETIEIGVSEAPELTIQGPEQVELCAGQATVLTAVGANGDLMWETGEEDEDISVSTAGWVSVSVTNDCGTVMDSVEVLITPLPTVTVTPAGPIILCEGQEVSLTAVGEGQFNWSSGESTATISVDTFGTIQVTATNDCGADQAAVEILNGGQAPEASIAVDGELSICPGETVTLTGSGGDSYEWNGAAADAELIVSQAGEYVLTAINDCGNDTETITISSSESAELTVVGGTEFALCNGEAAVVIVDAQGALSWEDGSTSSIRSFDTAGEYILTVTADCDELSQTISVVAEEVDARVDAFPMEGEAPLEVTFTDLTVGGMGAQWNFGGPTAIGPEVDYIFEQNGLYNVVMTTSTALGCTDQTNVVINVGACPFSVFIPSAFTPDDDGLNDQLRVVSNCISSFEMQIYDRWGREIFYSDSEAAIWTGADVSGYAVLNGEYPYLITVTDSNGDIRRITGSVTVIR